VLALLGEGVEAVEEADSDEEAGGGGGGGAEDPNAIDLGEGGEDGGEGEGGGGGGGAGGGGGPGPKKTRADRNRDARRRAAEAAAAARAALKRQRTDLDALGDLEAEVAAEAAARAAARARRETVRAERAAAGPGRLGKHRFVPAPPPVLLSEEVTGSLRQLAPYPMVWPRFGGSGAQWGGGGLGFRRLVGGGQRLRSGRRGVQAPAGAPENPSPSPPQTPR
jgi:nucleolar protein 53